MAFGFAHCAMLHTIQIDDVIPLLPAVSWVATTLVVMFPKDSCTFVCELCLMLSGTMFEMGFTA